MENSFFTSAYFPITGFVLFCAFLFVFLLRWILQTRRAVKNMKMARMTGGRDEEKHKSAEIVVYELKKEIGVFNRKVQKTLESLKR